MQVGLCVTLACRLFHKTYQTPQPQEGNYACRVSTSRERTIFDKQLASRRCKNLARFTTGVWLCLSPVFSPQNTHTHTLLLLLLLTSYLLRGDVSPIDCRLQDRYNTRTSAIAPASLHCCYSLFLLVVDGQSPLTTNLPRGIHKLRVG